MKIRAIMLVLMLAVPVAASAKSKVDGEAVFRENCLSCHDLKGNDKGEHPAYMGASLAKAGVNMDVQFVKDIVRTPDKFNPETLMPSFSSMAKEELEALVAYMKTLK